MASRRTLRALVPGLLLLVLSVATCRLDMLLKPSANRSQPLLAVSPTSVRDSARAGSDDVRRIEVELLNGGTGDGEYSWEADEERPWIRLSPRDGTLPDTMVITLDPEDLDPGTHEGTITITAPAMPDSQLTIAVTFIAQRAGLNVSPGSISHSTNVGPGITFEDTLRISNGGNGPLVWTARKDRPWVTLGAVAGTGPGIVPVTINTSGLPAGTHSDEIVVTAPGATGSPKRIDVTVTVFSPGLAVTPSEVRDTVPPETTEPQTHTLNVSNSGSGTMTWSAANSAPWVSLSDTGGTAPSSVVVTLNPTGLLPGVYQDTIAFTSPEATNDSISVPVELVIAQPCGEIVLNPDEERQGVLSANDCEAPHRPGHRANVYRVNLNAGDEFSVRLTASFNAYLILVDGAGNVLAENDECPSETGTACIMSFRIPTTGSYSIEATSAAPGESGSLTISVVRELPPTPPQGMGQFRDDGVTPIAIGAATPENVVVFRATLRDPNPGDAVRLEIELEPLGSPFIGVPTHTGDFVPVNGGGSGTLARAGGLGNGIAYHWQARTCDRTGRCSGWLAFGTNPESNPDFTVSLPPSGSSWPEQPASGTSLATRAPGGTP